MDFFAIWRSFCGDLNTPDSFPDDPYPRDQGQG